MIFLHGNRSEIEFIIEVPAKEAFRQCTVYLSVTTLRWTASRCPGSSKKRLFAFIGDKRERSAESALEEPIRISADRTACSLPPPDLSQGGFLCRNAFIAGPFFQMAGERL